MNKLILITGATGGIGKHYSQYMLERGYDVVLTYRKEDEAKKLQKELQSKFPNSKVDIMKIDLGSFDSIKEFVLEFKKKYKRLDVLVHNAGVYYFDSNKRESKEGVELNMQVHVVAPYILTGLLFELLQKTANSKVITVSSTEHKGSSVNVDDLILKDSFDSIGNMKAYSSSKFAGLVLMKELSRRLESHGEDITSLAAHPGVSITGIQHKGNPNAIQKFMIGIMGKVLAQKPEDAAKPLVMATVNGENGQFYGPTGFKESKGEPGLVEVDKNTLDEELGRKLWEKLEEVTNVRYLD